MAEKKRLRDLVIQKTFTPSSGILNAYLEEISKKTILSIEEEYDLILEAKNGSLKAKNKLCESHLRFVVSVAKQYQNQGLELVDLINEGNLGLLKSIEDIDSFDTTRGFKFYSRAVWSIRSYIIQAINKKSRVVRLPSNRVDQLSEINKQYEMFVKENGRNPVCEEIVELLEIKEETVSELFGFGRFLSIDQSYDDENPDRMDLLYSLSHRQSDKDLMEEPLKNDMMLFLNKYLKPNEVFVLTKSYGIHNDHEMQDWEIANHLGLCEIRIKQIKASGIKKLRKQPEILEKFKVYL